MAMVSINLCRVLADELRSILSGGLTLRDETVRYIDSTFGNPTAEELKAILADRDNCERESLLALLFSPEEEMQIRLEPLLAKSAFSRQDQRRIANLLLEPPTTARMHLPENRGLLQLQLSADDARQLIGLLHLDWELDPLLSRAVVEHVDGGNADRVRVIFRNARCRFCSRDVRFLSLALAGLDAGRQSDIESLRHALVVLADSPSPADMFQVLMQRKEHYAWQLQTAFKRDEMLRKSNPEIMMLQGSPIGGIDTVEAGRLITMIDRIALAVFSCTEPTASPLREAAYDTGGRGDTVKSGI